MSNVSRTYGAQARQNRREELLHAHLPLVKHLVGRLAMELPHDVPADPLEAAGLIGLLDAVATYDAPQDGDFEPHARRKIRQALLESLRRDWAPSAERLDQLDRLRAAYARLDPPVTLGRLGLEADLPADELVEALMTLRLLQALNPPGEGEPVRFEPAEQLASAWAKGQLPAPESEPFRTLETLAARAITLFLREDLRLQEVSEILRLPQLETKRIYRRALWGIGESLRFEK